MKIGVVGKPSSGKTTFFNAATLANAEVASYPFTTISPNTGTAFVRFKCPHEELGVQCNPRNAPCVKGTRFIPFSLLDVAGLVPGAHEGRGLGNQFLDDLMDANALIHIVDFSGKTDSEGNPTTDHDPEEDIKFLADEIDHWIYGILKKNWQTITRKARMKVGKITDLIYEQVSGLNIDRTRFDELVREIGIDEKATDDDLMDLAITIRKTKPIMIGANKIDLPESKDNYKRLEKKYELTPISAEAELALKKASEAGIISYIPGSSRFEILKQVGEKQRKALDYIRENVLEPFGSTGVQQIIEKTVYERLGYIVAFPVEDETHWTDKNGNVLPDAYLLPGNSTALDLAYSVHTEIGEKFMGAIDARTKRRLGKDHILKSGDVIKILVRR